jgi:biotin carboxylase
MTLLLFATTTGYQTRAFEEAVRTLGAELVYVTDRCHLLDDPWRDGAIAVKFWDGDGSVQAIRDAIQSRALAVRGVLAVGDQPVVLAARVAEMLGVPWHSVDAARLSRSKLLTRGRLLAAGLPVPWFFSIPLTADIDAGAVADRIRFPCVVKPHGLSASRGVMRANTPDEFDAALLRLRALLARPDIRALREPFHDEALVEGFIEGREYALEGVLEGGALRVLAIFDKPDPLDGPFFEETIYVTPSALSREEQLRMAGTIAHAATAMGFRHGPVHAECRINAAGVFVLEIAARPIGGLCARALRFVTPDDARVSLEHVLVRQALAEGLDGYGRDAAASGVMMIPIPRRGYYKGVEGLEAARRVPHVEDVVMTAKPDHLIEPLPEGASYLGFIFARAGEPAVAVEALRRAHAALTFAIEPAPPLAG